MNKANPSPFNIYQQKAIQTLKNLSKKYSEEILIDSLFSKSHNSKNDKDIYYILDDLKKNVSLEDLTSFLYNLMNGETYDTIMFSSEISCPLTAKVKIKKIEENEKNAEEEYPLRKNESYGNNFKNENINTNNENINNKSDKNKNGNNIIRIKLNLESSEKEENNENSNNRDKSRDKNKDKEKAELGKEKRNKASRSRFNKNKNIDVQRKIMFNKPIKKFNTNRSLEIINYKNKNSYFLEYITLNHRTTIVKYNNLIQKLICTNNLELKEFLEFNEVRKKINNLIKKKSCKKIREEILNGLGIIGKHYNKNIKGQIFIYKPKRFKNIRRIKFVCAECDKCDSFGYYNLMKKTFKVVKEHNLEIEKHKIYKVKDRYFINKLNQNKKVYDIQEYILFTKYD